MVKGIKSFEEKSLSIIVKLKDVFSNILKLSLIHISEPTRPY